MVGLPSAGNGGQPGAVTQTDFKLTFESTLFSPGSPIRRVFRNGRLTECPASRLRSRK
jgi:hypothetical protein